MTRHWLITVLILTSACSGDNEDGGNDQSAGEGDGGAFGNPAGSGGDGTTGDAAVIPGGDGDAALGVPEGDWVVPDELKLCGDRPCQCADGIDNDGDGTADGFDLECTGPNDDDEGTFATGISGDNMDPKWQDCFFDGNSGAGDDGCRYHTDCLTGDKSSDDNDCQVTQECVDFCLARTPNGCDCFGCCEIMRDDGSTINVVINSACDEEHLDDCTQCDLSETLCNNECGECELCPGKTIEDLPDSCYSNPPPPPPGDGGTNVPPDSGQPPPPDNGTPYGCDNGRGICESQSDCQSGEYCSQGCCLLIPPD